MELEQEIFSLIKKAATELPDDIIRELKAAAKQEDSTVSHDIMAKILENIEKAKNGARPICQDTGIPVFYVQGPKEYSEEGISIAIKKALDAATKEIPLRPNAIDSITGKNFGNHPVIHFKQSERLEIDLMMKGGGSENVSAIYQLPNKDINAHRDLDGVRKCIIDAIFKAQGKGCPPYIIGVAIGGSIEEVAAMAKKQLLRKLDDKNIVPELATLEERSLREINELGIGPLGLGGRRTALAVKAASGYRHPASFFVGISIACWCMRRQKYVKA